jgi:dihydroorotate dehydrogenase electron transfer subunit
MLPTPSKIQDMTCEVVHNRECGNGLKMMRLRPLAADGKAASFECQPGQFIMLDLPVSEFHFRRPFSVLATYNRCDLDIYYKIVGKGTRLMQELIPGDCIQCLGPLGIGFSEPTQPETALYIGGGIGIAPLYLLQRSIKTPGHCFYGVREQEDVGLEFELKDVFGEKNLYIATDDGSYGFHGNVCALLEQHSDKILAAQEAYICGPTRMMEAAANLLYQINPQLRVQVSLEEHMPCGTGACTGCVVPRSDQYLPSKVCVEGPVFDARSIQWDGALLPMSAFCEESPCPL